MPATVKVGASAFVLVLLLSATASPAAAQGQVSAQGINVESQAACSPVAVGTGGNVVNNINCNLGLTPRQLEEIRDAVLRGLDRHSAAQVERLSRRLGVTESALENLFRLLGQGQVPVQDLDAKVREFAVRHLELLEQVRRPTGADDPLAARLRSDAAAAIGRGDYDEAERLLGEAEDNHLAAAVRLRDTSDRRLLAAANARAQRAAIAGLRWDFEAEGRLLADAARLVPDREIGERIHYLTGASRALASGTRLRVEALALAQEARRLSVEAYGPNDERSLLVLELLGRVQERAGDWFGAAASRNQALQVRREALSAAVTSSGPDHPDVAVAQLALGASLLRVRQFGEAEKLLQDAIKGFERRYGPDDPRLAGPLRALADLMNASGRPAEAVAVALRVLALERRGFGPDDPRVFFTLVAIGKMLLHSDQVDEAGEMFGAALASAERARWPGFNAIAGAALRRDIAEVRRRQGRFDEASDLGASALGILERDFGPDSVEVQFAVGDQAELMEEVGQRSDAIALLSRAVRLADKNNGGPCNEASVRWRARLHALGADDDPLARACPDDHRPPHHIVPNAPR